MGANGSGKTTLIRCLNSLLVPDSGLVRVDGLTADHSQSLFEIRRRLGMVFQNPDHQIVSVTVEREIAFGLENLGMPGAAMHRRVNAALRRFKLEPYREESPNRLSGGERQRLALASVWVMDPRYWILDEPTSLLDPAGKADFFRLFRGLVRDSGAGMLLATQYAEEALACDRLVVMEKGRVQFDGEPRRVFRHGSVLRNLGLRVPVEAELGRQFA